jgi:hypothetical protein
LGSDKQEGRHSTTNPHLPLVTFEIHAPQTMRHHTSPQSDIPSRSIYRIALQAMKERELLVDDIFKLKELEGTLVPHTHTWKYSS